MKLRALKTFCQTAVLATVVCALAACSNPLYGKSDSAQNFHSKNINCNQLDFSKSEAGSKELRSLVHCLNSNHEVEAIETLIGKLKDSDLEPFAELLNHLVHDQPKLLYVMREAYMRAKKSGELQELQTLLAELLSKPKVNQALTKILPKYSSALAQYLFNSEVNTQMSGIYSLTHARAYQRLGAEIMDTPMLETLADATHEYLLAQDSIPLSDLYQMLSQHRVDMAWREAMGDDEKSHLQSIATFFEWLFTNGHYQTLSQGIQSVLTEPVRCFKGYTQLENPLASVLLNLSNKNALEAKAYFHHDLKNLYWVAQGYCEIPDAASKLIQLAEEATAIDGFAEVFTVARPLFSDSTFLNFLGSSASASFVKRVSTLAQDHFFQDIFTLITIDLETPISSDGSQLAKLLDSTIKSSTLEDTKVILEFLKPLLNKEAGYGFQFSKLLYKVTSGLPRFKLALNFPLQTRLQASTLALLSQQDLAISFDLIAKLIESKKLEGLVDQTLGYFSQLFRRAQFEFKMESFEEPKISKLPVSTWLLGKFSKRAQPTQATCADLTYEWSFSAFKPELAEPYLKQVDAILNCVNPNETFRSAQELIRYSINQQSYQYLLSAQKEVIGSAFMLSTTQALQSLNDFLNLSARDSATLREGVNLSSKMLELTQNAFLPKVDLRKFMGARLEDPQTFQTLAELTGPKPSRTRSSRPTLDISKLSEINAIISRDQRLNHAKIEVALSAFFAEYCPSFSPEQRNCDIDPDQVALYLQSPLKLYSQISKEYLSSSQTWLHPLLAKGLTHQVSNATQVSDFEYHLNPTLHLFRGSPQAPRALFNAVRRIQADEMSLPKFLEERAVRLTLIPYIFQIPTYPVSGKREFHPKIRLRLVSDLDRLELIAINADFKAFGRVSNMGMGFIREIGLAWGDVPEDKRPSSLNLLKDPSSTRTLKEVKEYIEGEMSRYDSNVLQRLGACDPRGRGRLHRFVASKLCNSELSDLSARVFNLRFLISLLGDELPVKDGGSGGLEFLRDLFYSLYEGNSDSQRNQYADGVSLSESCIKSPMQFPGPLAECQKDLLTLVSRITHLGLLHEASLAVLNAQDHPITSLGSLIERVSGNAELTLALSKSLSDDSGIVFIQDAVNFGFQAPPQTGRNLSLLTQALSSASDLNWVKLTSELVPKLPHAPTQNRDLFNSLLSLNSQELSPWVDYWLSHPESGGVRFFNSFSKGLTAPVRNDILNLLSDLTPMSIELAKLLQSAKKLPSLETRELQQDTHAWFVALANENASQARADLNTWIKSPAFDEFCKLFGDQVFTTKAYNFLESVNQNPDSKVFLRSCQDFINVH